MYIMKLVGISAAALLMAGCEAQQAQNNAAEQVQNTAAEQAFPLQIERVQLIWNQGLNKWMVKLNNGQEQDPATAHTQLAQNSGAAMFIVDIAGKAATFKNPGGLTVWEGAKSNPQGSTQIVGPVLASNDKLVFWDLNQGNAVALYYSLNLSDGTTIDPIIDNGGGTWLP